MSPRAGMQAGYRDGIPVVQNTLERNAIHADRGLPQQRYFNLETGAIERFDSTKGWVTDFSLTAVQADTIGERTPGAGVVATGLKTDAITEATGGAGVAITGPKADTIAEATTGAGVSLLSATTVSVTPEGGTPAVHVTDGTALPASAPPIANVLGLGAVVRSSAPSSSYLAGVFHLKQTAATTGSPQALEGYVNNANPSGTVTLAVGTVGNIEHSGAGTLADARAIGPGVVLSGPGTITKASGVGIAGGNRKIAGATGSIGTYIGVWVGDLSTTGAAVNRAADFDNVARFDYAATAGDTRFMLWDVTAGTLKRVSVGAADSGGAGFKVLRVPN